MGLYSYRNLCQLVEAFPQTPVTFLSCPSGRDFISFHVRKRNETKKNQVKPNPRPGVLTAIAFSPIGEVGELLLNTVTVHCDFLPLNHKK
jgi:hypothetical protein